MNVAPLPLKSWCAYSLHVEKQIFNPIGSHPKESSAWAVFPGSLGTPAGDGGAGGIGLCRTTQESVGLSSLDKVMLPLFPGKPFFLENVVLC